MPTLPAAGAVVKLTLAHILGGDQNADTHMFLAYTGPAPTAAQLNTLCNTVSTAWGTNMKSLAGADVTLIGVKATDLSQILGTVGSTTTSQVGTRAGAATPASASLLQNLQIARRYRGGKPRIYWPYGTQTDIATAQTWAAAFTNAFNTGFNAFLAAIQAAPWTGATITGLVNVSYFQGYNAATITPSGRAKNHPKPRTTPVVDVAFNYTVNPIIASQRRRIRFG